MNSDYKKKITNTLMEKISQLSFDYLPQDDILSIWADETVCAPGETDNSFNMHVYGSLSGKITNFENGDTSINGSLHIEPISSSDIAPKEKLDALTGAVSKADITASAINLIDHLHAGDTAIAIVDLDYFKYVNDHYGHQFGDEVLKKTVAIMKEAVDDTASVGRIGGDEFFIIFHNMTELVKLREKLSQIKAAMKEEFRNMGPQGDKPISVSIGCASYPKDADNYNDLFMVADYCLYLAKEKGRNRYIIYTPEKHASLEDIRNKKSNGNALINGRSDMALGDALTQMIFMIRYGKKPAPSSLIKEFAERFRIPLVLLLDASNYHLLHAAGPEEDDAGIFLDNLPSFLNEAILKIPRSPLNFVVNNHSIGLPDEMAELREKLCALNLQSFIVIPLNDAKGRDHYLILASVKQSVFWNEQHFMYYRLFIDALSEYEDLS